MDSVLKLGTFSERVEHKYWVPRAELNEVIAALRSFVPISYYSLAAWSSVRTVYLDTADLKSYRDYTNGLRVRWKIRLRQYGVDGTFGPGVWVEIKMKNRGISSKRRFSCTLADAALLVEQGVDVSARMLSRDGSDHLEVFRGISGLVAQRQLRPKVRLDYERIAFQRDPNDALRITLDRDMRFCSASNGRSSGYDGLILEVKYRGEAPEWFPELCEKFSIQRAHRMSKYAWAIGSLNGHAQ